MQDEIEVLKAQLSDLEDELDRLKLEYKQKESYNSQEIDEQKIKWTNKHKALLGEIKEVQEMYETERAKFQDQMQALNDTLQDLKHRAREEEEEEMRFLKQLDAELIAVAGRTQARLRDESVFCEGDTLQDDFSEETMRPESSTQLLSSISRARELLKILMERSIKYPISVPPLPSIHAPQLEIPDVSKSLTDSYRDSSLYSKVLINDEILNSLTMSEREAVVYSIINAGQGPENRRDVQLEDLLNITGADDKIQLSSAQFEDLSSIIEEDSATDTGHERIHLTFTLPDAKDSNIREASSIQGPQKLEKMPISQFLSSNSQMLEESKPSRQYITENEASFSIKDD